MIKTNKPLPFILIRFVLLLCLEKMLKLKLPLQEWSNNRYNFSFGGDIFQQENKLELTAILPFLYLGDEDDANDLIKLEKLGIKWILNVTEHVPTTSSDNGMKQKRIPVADSPHQNLQQYFNEAIDFIGEYT